MDATPAIKIFFSVGEPSGVGASVTCERTDPTAAAATATATMVAPIQATVNPIPRFMPTSLTHPVGIAITVG